MAKKDAARGRPADPSKLAIYCRIDRQAVEALDVIAGGMDPQPSRAQLIDRAVREFVERNRAKGK
jgi:predicted transcriptional regulator